MVKKILLIRLSALGDVVFALPALEQIRRLYPDAALSWLVEDKASTLLLHRQDLERVIVYPRKTIQKCLWNPLRWPTLIATLGKHLGAVRRDTYDLVFDFQGNLKSGIHLFASRGRRKIGFARGHGKEGNHIFSHTQVTPPAQAHHRIEKSVSLVQADYQAEEIQRPDIQVPPELLAEARAALEKIRPGDAPLLILHPGTSAFGAFKRWAPEKFGALARRVHREWGLESLVTWGPEEKDLARQVVATGGTGVIQAPPTRSLLHLAAFLSLGKAYVSGDTGPLHLANYLGIPSLALFGPKDPARYGPYFPPSAVVRSPVDCAPCSRRTCDDPICMKAIEVDAVFEALDQLLKQG